MVITTTKASSVQIYRKGAVVRRSGEAELEAGMNRLRISGMSASADLASLILYFPQGVSGSNIRTYLPEPDLLEETESGRITERLKLIEREKEVLAEQGERWKDLTAFQNMENVPLTELEGYIGRLPEKLLTLEKRLLELEKKKTSWKRSWRKPRRKRRSPLSRRTFMLRKRGRTASKSLITKRSLPGARFMRHIPKGRGTRWSCGLGERLYRIPGRTGLGWTWPCFPGILPSPGTSLC